MCCLLYFSADCSLSKRLSYRLQGADPLLAEFYAQHGRACWRAANPGSVLYGRLLQPDFLEPSRKLSSVPPEAQPAYLEKYPYAGDCGQLYEPVGTDQ